MPIEMATIRALGSPNRQGKGPRQMPQKTIQILTPVILLASANLLAGCVAAGIHGTTYAVKSSDRSSLEPAAEAGNPEAQTKLGISYCCRGPGFSTQKATEWLCKAAHQDYAIAQYELGRIYSGDTSRTPAPGQKLTHLALAKKNEPLSLMWFELAASNGHEKAAERTADLRKEMGDEDVGTAEALSADWRSASCHYDQAFSD